VVSIYSGYNAWHSKILILYFPLSSTLGDATNGCLSSGSHYNPFNKNHGAPSDTDRHVGDLGNIASDKNGVANINFSDELISLNGAQSIIG
jgi:superoxide dismutase, Cu-Zn family